MKNVEYSDLMEIIDSEGIKWNQLENSTFLITGGTGLIGSMMTKMLLLRNELYGSNITIYLLVRDIERSRRQLQKYKNSDEILYIESSVENADFTNLNVDYIVHTAAPTKSSFFVNNPVETIESIVLGTMNVLKYASKSSVKSMVNVSSMESYGTIESDSVSEDHLGIIPLNSLRSSYPEAKRLTELLAYSYSQEYSTNVTSLRLAQTFGAGITENENRVFKYFCDCVLNGENIVLKSTGQTIINFCYLSDAIKAILILLIDGERGETYNASGESYEMTIKDIAEWLIKTHGNENEVIYDIDETQMFAPVNKMILNNEKIKKLGWNPKVDVKEAYSRLLLSISETIKTEGNDE
ncbi:NAD(P)-dependent oxidoreductase [Erysipelothrix sp. P66]|uniref:NAD-dependent epimerase/dehydratase family protein n=1 Tax=Erysipelothrix sp. P66 TaxID=3141531 RepID=UPI00315DDB20